MHVNFGLRGAASDDDEAFLRALAAEHGVTIFVKRVAGEEHPGEGTQEWARRIRRAEADRLTADGWLCATAHHLDDVAENALLRLARGVAPASLAGLREFEAPWWRPLLREKKADLAAAMTQAGLSHREDASNATLEYSRNVIRHRILPELDRLFPGAADRIAACAQDAEDLGAYSDEALDAARARHAGKERLWLTTLTRGAARHALARMIRSEAPGHRHLSRHFLDEFLDHLESAPSSSTPQSSRDLPQGGRLVALGDAVIVEPAKHATSLARQDVEVILTPGSYVVITMGQTEWSFMLSPDSPTNLANSLSPRRLRVYGPSRSKALRFKGFGKAWKLVGVCLVELDDSLVAVLDSNRGVAYAIDDDGKEAAPAGQLAITFGRMIHG